MAVVANLEVPTGEISVIIYPELDEVAVARRPDLNRVESNFTVPNYGTSIGDLAERPGFTVGWGQFPDGCEVIYLYDRNDNNFGYAINLDAPSCSEWGYAPFDDVDGGVDPPPSHDAWETWHRAVHLSGYEPAAAWYEIDPPTDEWSAPEWDNVADDRFDLR